MIYDTFILNHDSILLRSIKHKKPKSKGDDRLSPAFNPPLLPNGMMIVNQ